MAIDPLYFYRASTYTSNGRPNNDSYDVSANKQRFGAHIGIDKLQGAEKQFAQDYIDKNVTADWNPGWFPEMGGKFNEALSAYRNESDINKARGRFDEITNVNSKYNQDMYNRLDRMNKPDNYEGSLLNRAMGLGEKSSSFLAQKGFEQQKGKANETTYNEFSDLKQKSEGQALSYLDLASGRESSLLKIMSDTRIQESQLKQQKDIEDQQRKSQLYNSIIKTVIGGAISLVPGGQVAGMGIMSSGINAWGGGNSNPVSATGNSYT